MNNSDVYYTVCNIFKNVDRSEWYNLIKPLIEDVDMKTRKSKIGKYWYAFIPDELKIDYPWKYNIRDILTDGTNIRVIRALPELDPRSSLDYFYMRVMEQGNTYYTIRIDENGNDIDINNDTYYLHDYFNVDKLYKLDPKTEKFYKDIIKNKKYWFE